MDEKRLKSKIKKRSVLSFLSAPEAEPEAVEAVAGQYLLVFFWKEKWYF